MRMKKVLRYSTLFVAVFSAASIFILQKQHRRGDAGPFSSQPAWCTPGSPNASSTYCAGRRLTVKDSAGWNQSRWMGQYSVRTTATSWWLTYCLRDDLGHPIVTSNGTIMSNLIDKNGNTVALTPKYSYILWKWGDTSDNNRAAAVWMLGHYYAKDRTDSGHIIVPNLNASSSSTVNSLAQSMDAEAATQYGAWKLTVNAPTPPGWSGSSTPGNVMLKSATNAAIAGATVTLSASGGTVTPSSGTTNASGILNFSFTSSGGPVTITANVASSPATYKIINPPGGADQYVGSSGGNRALSANRTAEPLYAVGDYVWYDTDQDGIQDVGEAAVVSATVELLSTSDVVLDSTVTDANGHYVFDGLSAGTYKIKFSDMPAGYVFTTQNAPGSTVSDDSNPAGTGITANFTLDDSQPNMRAPIPADGVIDAGLIDPTIDAGIYENSPEMDLKITKSLFNAGPYIRGDSVRYDLVVTNNGPNAAAANWSITDLLPTGLTFAVTQPNIASDAGFTCGAPSSITGGNSITCTNNASLAPGAQRKLALDVTINANAPLNSALKNVTYVSPAPGDIAETNPLVVPTFATNTTTSTTNNDSEEDLIVSMIFGVGDYVWYDDNHNGIQDVGELPVNNVTVELLDTAENVIATTATNASGHYVFDEVYAGTYSVKFSNLPANYSFTAQEVSSGTEANDSNADAATGLTNTFVIGENETNMRAVVPGDGVTLAQQINPTIDAGLVVGEIDLTITKRLVTAGPYKRGQTLQYELVGKNNGPSGAVAGWSMTDLLPTGLSFSATQPHGDSDAGFTCSPPSSVAGGSSLTCTSSSSLGVGAERKLYLTVKIDDNAAIDTSLHNLGYISPASGEKTETNLLQVPTFATVNTASTSTNNDSEAVLSLSVESVANTGFKNIIKDTNTFIPLGLLLIVAGYAAYNHSFKRQ